MNVKKVFSGIISVFMLASCISVPVLADDSDNTSLNDIYKIENGSFETPLITSSQNYSIMDMDSVPSWSTTASDKKIEIFKENSGTYIKGYTLRARSGNQGAELNANEPGTLYQDVNTYGGSVFEWGLSHHGRNGNDTMLLIIGPKQDIAPTKPDKNSKDQFMKFGDWVHSNEELLGLTIPKNGCAKEFTVYSRKFAANGEFEGSTNVNDCFSLSKNSYCSEAWKVWMINSANDAWYDYGTNRDKEKVTYTGAESVSSTKNGGGTEYSSYYSVPEGQSNTTFAFVAYDSTPLSASDSALSYGNLIDDIDFKTMHPITIRTSDGGTGSCQVSGKTISTEGTNVIDVIMGEKYTITATKTDDESKFKGAYINSSFVSSDKFTDNGDGIYTLSQLDGVDLSVDEPILVRLVFTKPPKVGYDPNGGTIVGGEKDKVVYKEFHDTGDSYTSDDPIGETGWKFTGWLDSLGNSCKTSTVTRNGDNFDIVYDNDTSNVTTIPISDGLTFEATWKFKQTSTVQLLNSAGEYVNSSVCGKIEHSSNIDSDGYADRSSIVSFTATPYSGYQFDGWYDKNGNKLNTTSATYSVNVNADTLVNDVYARFSPNYTNSIFNYSDIKKIADVDGESTTYKYLVYGKSSRAINYEDYSEFALFISNDANSMLPSIVNDYDGLSSIDELSSGDLYTMGYADSTNIITPTDTTLSKIIMNISSNVYKQIIESTESNSVIYVPANDNEYYYGLFITDVNESNPVYISCGYKAEDGRWMIEKPVKVTLPTEAINPAYLYNTAQ